MRLRVLLITMGWLGWMGSARAQDCALIRETDPYTKLTTLSTGYHKLSGGALLLDASKTEIDWMLEVGNGNACFDDEATIQVFFEGTKLRLLFRNGGTMNCEGLLHVIFKNAAGTNYQLNKLITLPIQRILITNAAKKEWEILPDPEQRAKWNRSATCLVGEAKQLLTP
jgi:hypothetical protein